MRTSRVAHQRHYSLTGIIIDTVSMFFRGTNFKLRRYPFLPFQIPTDVGNDGVSRDPSLTNVADYEP